MRENGTYADHTIVDNMSRLWSGQQITIVREPFNILTGKQDPDKPVIYLGYISNTQHYVSIEPDQSKSGDCGPSRNVTIEVEQYYAVDYVDRFYVGRVSGKGKKKDFFHEVSS